MSSAIHNGTLYPNAVFVNLAEEADVVLDYDEMRYDKKNNCWLYFYHGYLVATSNRKENKNDQGTR